MTIGTSLLVIAVGAILRYAVTIHSSAIDIRTVGTILLIVGVVGLVLSLVWMAMARNSVDAPPYDRPPDAPYPR